jgi:hypothetical protein
VLWGSLRRANWALMLALAVGVLSGLWAESQMGWMLRGKWPIWTLWQLLSHRAVVHLASLAAGRMGLVALA